MPSHPAVPPAPARRAAGLPADVRRDRIVEAALPLVVEHGPAVTSRQIAEAAGVAEGTIFRVFADKDALVDAVVARAMDLAPLDARIAAMDASHPWEVRLVEAVGILQERVARVWQLLSAVGLRRPPGRRPGLHPSDVPALVALLAEQSPALRYPPADAAVRLRALAVAGGHPALMGDHPLSPEDVVDLFLEGARRRPHP